MRYQGFLRAVTELQKAKEALGSRLEGGELGYKGLIKFLTDPFSIVRILWKMDLIVGCE